MNRFTAEFHQAATPCGKNFTKSSSGVNAKAHRIGWLAWMDANKHKKKG